MVQVRCRDLAGHNFGNANTVMEAFVYGTIVLPTFQYMLPAREVDQHTYPVPQIHSHVPRQASRTIPRSVTDSTVSQSQRETASFETESVERTVHLEECGRERCRPLVSMNRPSVQLFSQPRDHPFQIALRRRLSTRESKWSLMCQICQQERTSPTKSQNPRSTRDD